MYSHMQSLMPLVSVGPLFWDITYQSSLRNNDADGMSRYPHEKVIEEQGEKIKIDNDTVRVICSCTPPPYIEILTISNINIIDATDSPGQMEMTEIGRK